MTALAPIRNPIFAALSALSRRSDSIETIALPDDTEATAYIEHDADIYGWVFHARLLGVLTADDALLTPDEAVELYGLEWVTATERLAVDKAQEDGE